MHSRFAGARHQGEFGRVEERHIWGAIAGIAAAAIAAAGAAGGAAIAAQGSKSAARTAGRVPNTTNIPAPKGERALAHYYQRLLALNAGAVPPSFNEYVQSGGTAKYPFHDTGLTPKEAADLGIVAPGGGDVPFVDPNAETTLTQEQQLYLGGEAKRFGSHGPLVRAYNLSERLKRVQGRPDTPRTNKREENLQARIQRILQRASTRSAPPDSSDGGY